MQQTPRHKNEGKGREGLMRAPGLVFSFDCVWTAALLALPGAGAIKGSLSLRTEISFTALILQTHTPPSGECKDKSCFCFRLVVLGSEELVVVM